MNHNQFEKQNKMRTEKILLGVLAGMAAGAALGILFAPDKGSATRKKIMDMADDLTDSLKEKITDSIKTFTDQLENIKDDAKDLVEKATLKVEDGYNSFKNTEHHDNILQRGDLKF